MKGASKGHGNVEQDKNASVLLRAPTLVFPLFAKKQRFELKISQRAIYQDNFHRRSQT